MKLRKIISGGQTGADRGGLEAAFHLELAHGGWCPAGRRAADGIIPEQYKLTETVSREYKDRTLRNIVAADATLIVPYGPPGKGTSLTIRECARFEKPHLIINMREARHDLTTAFRRLISWLRDVDPTVLNVAGSKESKPVELGELPYRSWPNANPSGPSVERLTKALLVEAIEHMRRHS